MNVGDATEAKLRDLRRRVGMIFQQFKLFTSRTVAANVAYPLKVAGWKKADSRQARHRAARLRRHRRQGEAVPRRLSGGQKQRVGIARAIATDPRILLADEATSASTRRPRPRCSTCCARDQSPLGITIVVITHQISIVHELCDQVIVMDGGRVVDSGDTYRVFAHPRADLTKRFVAAVTQGVPSGEPWRRSPRAGESS